MRKLDVCVWFERDAQSKREEEEVEKDIGVKRGAG